jgi:hypothetical protein
MDARGFEVLQAKDHHNNKEDNNNQKEDYN